MNIVCLSGGKDSTAMLFMMKERGIPVDKILFFDVGKEYPAMYEHLKKVKNCIGQEIEHIVQERTFEYWMLEHVRLKGKWKGVHGYGWPNYLNRWCTSIFKTDPLKKIKTKYPGASFFMGIAKDEEHRTDRNKKISENICYPLVEWGKTEKECLELCYAKGFTWDGLYELYGRVSCWCCPLKRKRDYEILRINFPEYYSCMKEWDKKVDRPLKYLTRRDEAQQELMFK